YAVQQQPRGLCDAIFRAEPFARQHDRVLIGLPDTVWFPENAYRTVLDPERFQNAEVNLLLFPVTEPKHFDAVVTDDFGYVREVQVKRVGASSHWVWGAVTMTGRALHELRLLWEARHRVDEYLGDLLNAFIAAGHVVRGTAAGELYMDVGTLDGYHHAQAFL